MPSPKFQFQLFIFPVPFIEVSINIIGCASKHTEFALNVAIGLQYTSIGRVVVCVHPFASVTVSSTLCIPHVSNIN